MKIIDTEAKLKFFLKIFKKTALKEWHHMYSLYPNFCVLLDKDGERFKLPKQLILETALDVFLEE